MLYMLDTDICAFIARQRSPRVTDRFQSHRKGDLAMSVVTFGELLEMFAQVVPVIPMDPEVASFYGRVRLDLEQRGQIIGANDLWIASHCLQLGLTLVTNNEREFRRIPNLPIENWTK
jgi:tRNA(fMet)-specific endonuclease VapC